MASSIFWFCPNGWSISGVKRKKNFRFDKGRRILTTVLRTQIIPLVFLWKFPTFSFLFFSLLYIPDSSSPTSGFAPIAEKNVAVQWKCWLDCWFTIYWDHRFHGKSSASTLLGFWSWILGLSAYRELHRLVQLWTIRPHYDEKFQLVACLSFSVHWYFKRKNSFFDQPPQWWSAVKQLSLWETNTTEKQSRPTRSASFSDRVTDPTPFQYHTPSGPRRRCSDGKSEIFMFYMVHFKFLFHLWLDLPNIRFFLTGSCLPFQSWIYVNCNPRFSAIFSNSSVFISSPIAWLAATFSLLPHCPLVWLQFFSII